MWIRAAIGVVCCLVGAVFVAQGTNALHGSAMSGHGRYVVLGGVLIVIGALLLAWASRLRQRRTGSSRAPMS
jgi:uncharacterized membrane protein YidH (DUF202 family)